MGILDLESATEDEKVSAVDQPEPLNTHPQISPLIRLDPHSLLQDELAYSCLIIPRTSGHELVDAVPDFLQRSIGQICTDFVWRLDFLQVQPAYLQWVLTAPLATPPSRCIQTIREHTSRGILANFPQYSDHSLSQDFWAPGYLVLVSAMPHPAGMIEEFIRLTRQQQSLSRELPHG